MHRIEIQNEDDSCEKRVESTEKATNVSQVVEQGVGYPLNFIKVMIKVHENADFKTGAAAITWWRLEGLIFRLKYVKNLWG